MLQLINAGRLPDIPGQIFFYYPAHPLLDRIAKSTIRCILIRGAIFRKITSQNQTDTNEMATTETKYQTDFYSAQKYQYITKF